MRTTTTLVVMGVSGSGKSAVAAALTGATGWTFVEGDDLHPEVNRRTMAAGTPLTDDDRWPWLRRIAQRIGAGEQACENLVVTCSALRRSYRDLLRDGHPSVRFVYLHVGGDVLRERVAARHHEYMPAALLDSQLGALEPPDADERAITVDAAGPVEATVAAVLDEVGVRDPR
ncbi:gluconokinase [Pseudonocardia endophytica]|uniref:Gluconokinase n=1 Tax=Pseudonocardia endophytica TaxID=401976 RepID=A0A4R1HJZ1_PSEEN|nr:gluconokinase [Pseudonocardia endophytica]TCK22704.1 gluconate kinase (SKI family) [Pseudonocardia endophytica]